MQPGNDHPGSEPSEPTRSGSTAGRATRNEDSELTRACHDLAVANDAGPDPDPAAHDLPRTGPGRE